MLLEELNEVDILRNDNRSAGPRSGMNLSIRRSQQVQLRHVPYVNGPEVNQPPRKDRRELSIHPDRRESHREGPRLGGEHGMIEPARRVEQARRDVGRFQIWIGRENLSRRFSGSEEVEHVNHADPHPTNAGPAAALIGVRGDAFE